MNNEKRGSTLANKWDNDMFAGKFKPADTTKEAKIDKKTLKNYQSIDKAFGRISKKKMSDIK